MEIKKVNVHEALTCGLEEDIVEIAKKLESEKERRIFVIDGDEKVKGIITTTDLVYKALAEKAIDKKAKDVMTDKVRCVDIKEDLEKALGIMNELKTFNCPVVDDGKLIGLVAYHDIVGHVISSVEK